MEKHPHPFDDLIKEALKGHQLAPPGEAKAAFLREASAIFSDRKGWFKWYYIPVMVFLISGTIAFFYLRNESVPAGPAGITAEPIKPGPGQESKMNSGPEQLLNKENIKVATEKSAFGESKINSDIKTTTFITDLPINNVADKTITQMPSGVNSGHNDAINVTSEETISQTKNAALLKVSSVRTLDSLFAPAIRNEEAGSQPEIALADSSAAMPSPLNPEAQKPMRSRPAVYFTAGPYYQPEWMFNTVEGGKFVNNFGFEGIFYRGPVSIRTGVGISISKGITENAVEYNNYLGAYNKLDSVTFVFNESSHDFLPKFYLSEEKVWDSISKLDSTRVVKRYTYLQVPFVLGFDFWQKGRFTVGVRVGNIMSILLNTQQLSGAYNPGENRVIGIDRITPDRVSINWQAIGGLNASARLTRSIFFEVEPQAKYYYQSIYEKSGITRKPWSVGVRTAVIYKF